MKSLRSDLAINSTPVSPVAAARVDEEQVAEAERSGSGWGATGEGYGKGGYHGSDVARYRL